MTGWFHLNLRFIFKSSSPLQAMICLGTQTSPANRIVLFHVISSQAYMLQLREKLKLYTNLGQDTVHKALIRFLIKIVLVTTCRLPAPTKVWNITGT